MITVYAGIVPDRTSQTDLEFTENVYNYLVWIDANFVPDTNNSIVDINTDLTTMNAIKNDVALLKNDAQTALTATELARDITLDASNYDGDWVANFNTNGYPSSASVSYLGNIYYSKIPDNLVEPTLGVSTNEWYFSGRKEYKFKTITADTTAVDKDFLKVDTLTTGAVIVTLPSNPTLNDKVGFLDVKGNFSTANLTVARNGQLLMGLAEDMIVETNNISFELIFTENNWRLI